MQLVIKFGALYLGATVDLVVAHYDDEATVDLTAFPGCVLVPWAGSLAGLERIGPAPFDPTCDGRPYAAPKTLDLALYAKAKKKLVEEGGITLAGAFVDTSLKSQNRLSNGHTYLMSSGDTEVTFQKPDDTFVTLPAAEFEAIALAVGRHVQACFKTLGQVVASINAGTITTLAQVDAAFAAITA